jgi:hypothetical protein
MRVRQPKGRTIVQHQQMKTLIIAVLFTGSLFGFSGEIADFHAKLARDKAGNHGKSRNSNNLTPTDHGITEMGIEHTH